MVVVVLLVVLHHGEDDGGGSGGRLYLRVSYQGEGGDSLATVTVCNYYLLEESYTALDRLDQPDILHDICPVHILCILLSWN